MTATTPPHRPRKCFDVRPLRLLARPRALVAGPAIPRTLGPNPIPHGIHIPFRDTLRRVKASAAYTQATGEALGIIGPDQVDQDPATLAPTLSLRTSGGQVEVVCYKGSQEGVEVQKDSGAGAFAFLSLDTSPNDVATSPFHTPAAKWKYRANYANDAQRVGKWSNVAEISVGG